MGYYIETPGKLKGKAKAIMEEHGAHRILYAPVSLVQVGEGKAVICVVDNGMFEAAAFCYSDEELAVFAQQDERRKDWLIMDWAKACELTGYRREA